MREGMYMSRKVQSEMISMCQLMRSSCVRSMTKG